ncbi:response regulator transcription factor [Taibaiella lutea]|uniref:Response regulator transcription factor n=1 Tax=Taibaiella lutea TaxID=2608001 RepID=A0A5M6CEA3_9BACT|nr:LytTR family DNA-binding domain-containing protein [Taibaiella lutea]KAA5533508.1 response regulator transcription factor [Taibaiella lutea]
MITAIAIDDEPPALKVIEAFCKDFDFIDLQKTFTRTDEAARHLKKFPVDLLFLDIQMPSITGIDFYKSIEQHTMVIFTTAYSEYAVEGFNLSAIDYLLKPFTKERFAQAVQKTNDYSGYLKQSHQSITDYLFVRADYTLHKIAFDDIILIEGLDDYIKIQLDNGRPIVARMTMKSIMEKLPEQHFIRVHRSFIVAIKKVSQVRNKIIYLSDIKINIGQSYEAAVAEKFRI